MSTEIVLPEMGEGVVEATITRWLKAEGEPVEQDDPILEVETDKVTTEIVAEAAGSLLKILVQPGQMVAVGTVLGIIGLPEEDVSVPSPKTDGQVDQPVPSTAGAALSYPRHHDRHPPYSRKAAGKRVSPVVARMAVEHNLDLTQITGTGHNKRITKKDVLAYIESRPPASPAPTAPVSPSTPTPQPPAPVPAKVPGQVVPLTGIRRAIAEHMVMSKATSPHVTTVFEADFSAVMTHRRAHKAQFAQKGVRLTFTPYLIAAIAQALQVHPMANSSWSDEGIILRPEINIGMATALEQGLIVPVIKQADELNLMGLARTVNDLAERARSNKLTPDEVRGGTFTLTNHGVSGSLFATPIINQPQCGILGAGAIQERVVVIDGMIAVRPMAYLCLTFDHRILDGATADYFVAEVKRVLESWQ